MIKESLSRKIFNVCNIIFMILMCFFCLFPIVHILALSFSSKYVAEAGMVSLWPVDFTLDSYKFVIEGVHNRLQKFDSDSCCYAKKLTYHL